MRRLQDGLLLAVATLLAVGLIAAVASSVGYSVKASTREYEYKILRKEYQERIEKERNEFEGVIGKLNDRIESEAYVNKRRYEVLQAEIYDKCPPPKHDEEKHTLLENNLPIEKQKQ